MLYVFDKKEGPQFVCLILVGLNLVNGSSTFALQVAKI